MTHEVHINGSVNLLNRTEWRKRTRKIVSCILKMNQCEEYAKFELRRTTTQLIDNYMHNAFLCTVGGMNCIHVQRSGGLSGTHRRQNLILTSNKVL